MVIRKANSFDKGEIVKIFIDSATLNPIDKNNKELKNYINNCLNEKSFLVLVAEINKKIIGVCICNFGRISKTDADLVDIYVLKKFRNRGIGNKLMKELYKELKKKGIKNLGLYSENNNKTLNFYKKQGFQIGRLIRRCDKKIK
ncbi:GNAT family N-acetyltransferase [Candidatus Pacearchaeota archaeon]|nr:GNAT family N-acetyltransferase [Candidatus Pacearchaeota archaeon]